MIHVANQRGSLGQEGSLGHRPGHRDEGGYGGEELGGRGCSLVTLQAGQGSLRMELLRSWAVEPAGTPGSPHPSGIPLHSDLFPTRGRL